MKATKKKTFVEKLTKLYFYKYKLKIAVKYLLNLFRVIMQEIKLASSVIMQEN